MTVSSSIVSIHRLSLVSAVKSLLPDESLPAQSDFESDSSIHSQLPELLNPEKHRGSGNGKRLSTASNGATNNRFSPDLIQEIKQTQESKSSNT